MSRMIALFLSVVLFMSTYLGVSFNMPTEKLEDVSYGSNSWETFDMYIPYSAYRHQENGCILFIHGGSWIEGDKKDMASYCENAVENGYIAVTMNYILFNNDTFENGYSMDEVLSDVTSAINKIKSISDEKGLNIDKLATSGFSAGAHISMLYSYKEAKNSPIKIVFTANRSGPTYFNDDYWISGVSIYGFLLNGIQDYEGKDYTDEEIEAIIKAACEKISPVTYVTKDIVPSLFAYGEKDTIVPYPQAEVMREALDKVGAKYKMFTYPNSGHGLESDPDIEEKYNTKFLQYCEKYFGY